MPQYDSPAAAHAPTHGGYPDPQREPTMAECATRLGFDTVDQMVAWVQSQEVAPFKRPTAGRPRSGIGSLR